MVTPGIVGEDEDIDLSPLRILLQDEEEEERQQNEDNPPPPPLQPPPPPPASEEVSEEPENPGSRRYKQQQHYLKSISSSVQICQVPSQGLSFQLWPAATTLVNLLDHHHHHQSSSNTTTPLSPIFNHLPRHRPPRILELGSGTGLAGIAAAAILGSSVTLTDLPHVLQNLQLNVTANSSLIASRNALVDVASLRWGEIDDMKSIGSDFDIILGSDVVYYDHLYDPLLQTLKFFLSGGEKEEESETVFLMAHLRRWKKDSVFFKKAKKMFHVELIHTDLPAPGTRIGVAVYSFTRKKKKN